MIEKGVWPGSTHLLLFRGVCDQLHAGGVRESRYRLVLVVVRRRYVDEHESLSVASEGILHHLLIQQERWHTFSLFDQHVRCHRQEINAFRQINRTARKSSPPVRGDLLRKRGEY